MNEKTNMYVVLDINITVVTTDNHMDVIQVQIGRIMIDDVTMPKCGIYDYKNLTVCAI